VTPTIAFDFDGVIHRYSRGWQDGTIYDPPIPGALEALDLVLESFPVFILTSREPEQVMPWLESYGFDVTIDELCGRCRGFGARSDPDGTGPAYYAEDPCQVCQGSGLIRFWDQLGQILVTQRKLPAAVYVDDRGLHFTSWAQTMDELEKRLSGSTRAS
jgi:hypothetical protein